MQKEELAQYMTLEKVNELTDEQIWAIVHDFRRECRHTTEGNVVFPIDDWRIAMECAEDVGLLKRCVLDIGDGPTILVAGTPGFPIVSIDKDGPRAICKAIVMLVAQRLQQANTTHQTDRS